MLKKNYYYRVTTDDLDTMEFDICRHVSSDDLLDDILKILPCDTKRFVFENLIKDFDIPVFVPYSDFKSWDTLKKYDYICYITDNIGGWSCLDPEYYIDICDDLGLDFSDYDDPDIMFADIENAINDSLRIKKRHDN